jgi:hypothetical protein
MQMLDYDRYVMRHGEYWVQDVVERIERNENIRPGYAHSLEQRWNALMNAVSPQRLAA